MMRSIARRTALASIAAFGAGVTLAPRTARAQATAIRVGCAPTDTYAQAYFAAERGFFRAAGLDVTVTTLPNSGAIAAAIAGGSLDVGVGSPVQVAAAHEASLPFLFFAPGGLFVDTDPTTLLMVPRNSPLTKPSELVGKVVADDNLKSLTAVAMHAWLTRENVDPTSVKFIEMPFATMGPSLAAGRIDAGVIAEPALSASRTGAREFANPYEAIGKRFYISAWFASKDWLDKNGASAKKFAAVMEQTSAWANRNPALSAPILANYTKISPELARTMRRAHFGETFDAALLQPPIDAAAHAQVLKSSIAAASLMFNA